MARTRPVQRLDVKIDYVPPAHIGRVAKLNARLKYFLLLMSEESDLSLEAARQLEPLARELGEHARHERSLEYQILHETGTKRLRALEELLALHIATRPREQAKLSAERLLQADTPHRKVIFI